MLDGFCTFGHSDRHAYYNATIETKEVKSTDIVTAFVYCYASTDFNGDLVCLRSDGDTYGDTLSGYNLNMKGVWQKLSISASCKNGVAPVSLYFNKTGVTSFVSLTGHVIFAYPKIQVVTVNDNVRSRGKFELYEKAQIQQKSNDSKCNDKLGTPYPRIFTSGLGYFNLARISPIIHQNIDTAIIDKDFFRNWISNIINEDTSYNEPETFLKIDTLSKFFVDDRLSRWHFALQIFSNEYNLKQKFFGAGFNHLNWYGYYFLHDKTASDWPHNPFLSILLYSGILGLLIYCFFLYKVFYYYIKYIKEYPLLFIFFLITFFFSFFSGGSPFDPPIMGFFSILPFFIHAVHKRDKENSGKEISDKK
jgi:hypothetical protein